MLDPSLHVVVTARYVVILYFDVELAEVRDRRMVRYEGVLINMSLATG